MGFSGKDTDFKALAQKEKNENRNKIM